MTYLGGNEGRGKPKKLEQPCGRRQASDGVPGGTWGCLGVLGGTWWGAARTLPIALFSQALHWPAQVPVTSPEPAASPP